MIITLCGFMGAGKTTVGKFLASLLCCEQIDLDAYICKREGKSVPEIFDAVGEAGFRAAEAECLKDIVENYGGRGACKDDDAQNKRSHGQGCENECQQDFEEREDTPEDVSCVISLGGGAPLNPGCFNLICERTMCFYLRVPVDVLQTRLIRNNSQRPLLAGKSVAQLREYVESMVVQREPVYRKCSKRVVETAGRSIEQIALEIANF